MVDFLAISVAMMIFQACFAYSICVDLDCHILIDSFEKPSTQVVVAGWDLSGYKGL